MFIGKYNRSIIITYLGVVVAIVGSYLAMVKDLPRYAVLCLVIVGICDLFDGLYARSCKRDEEEKAFGIQIDSLADMVGFTFLPISICYSMGLDSIYHVILFAIFTLAAITRLGFFNISVDGNSDKPVKYYRGLPVTYVALILSIAWLLSLAVNKELFNAIYTIIIALISLLFIVDVKVIKPKGVFYIIFPLIAIAMIFILLFVGV